MTQHLDLDALQAAAVDAWKKNKAIKISPYVLDHLIDRLRKAEAASKWVSVDERLPEVGVGVMVYTPPTPHDWPGSVNITFDCIDPDADEPTSWMSHNEHYEHFCCVAKPEGSIGPSEKAPYTHWIPIPAAPTADSEGAAAKCISCGVVVGGYHTGECMHSGQVSATERKS